MFRLVGRAVMFGVVGALAGVAAVAIGFARQPGLTFEMDRELPSFATGFYPVEQAGSDTFAWTSGKAEVRVPRFERHVDWRCGIRLRGARVSGTPLPTVTLSIDGVGVLTRPTSNEFEDLSLTIPARTARGLSIVLTSTPTFVPPSDPRELGVQIDRLDCQPANGAFVWPPTPVMIDAGATAALFGAVIGLTDLAALPAALGLLLLAAAQALPFSAGPAPYSIYADRAIRLAFWTAMPAALLTVVARQTRHPLHRAAQFVIVWSAAIIYLQLLALLHPSKQVIDAVFHAHRLEWVMDGRYFFTQPMPSGVQFPYAIGLYVFAAPWTAFTRDYVSLLRIVTVAAESIAGALLYWMVVRRWGDRLAGGIAVALFSVAPLSYGVLGNANLTNAFGQAVALVAVAVATVWQFRTRDIGSVAALMVITAWALLSHVSTFGLLVATLGSAACLYRLFGGPAMREPARAILIALTAAAVIAVAVYYGHFLDVYKDLNRVRAAPASVASGTTPGTPPASSASTTAPAPGLAVRLGTATTLSLGAVGWPMVILAAVGLWRVFAERTFGRLDWMLGGWAIAWVAFLAVGLAPVNVQFARYAVEFIARVDYATYPAVAILAGRGAAWSWRTGPLGKFASAGLLLGSLALGLRAWMAWLT